MNENVRRPMKANRKYIIVYVYMHTHIYETKKGTAQMRAQHRHNTSESSTQAWLPSDCLAGRHPSPSPSACDFPGIAMKNQPTNNSQQTGNIRIKMNQVRTPNIQTSHMGLTCCPSTVQDTTILRLAFRQTPGAADQPTSSTAPSHCSAC